MALIYSEVIMKYSIRLFIFFLSMIFLYCGGTGGNSPSDAFNYKWFPRHTEDQYIEGSTEWSGWIRTFMVAGNDKGQSVIINTIDSSLNIQCYEHGLTTGPVVSLSMTSQYSGMCLQTVDMDNNGNIYISTFQYYTSGSTTYRYLRIFSMQFGDSSLELLYTITGNQAAGSSTHTSYIDNDIYAFVASSGTDGPVAVIKQPGKPVITQNILSGSTMAGGFQVVRVGSIINIFFASRNQILNADYNMSANSWNVPVIDSDYIFMWSGTAYTYSMYTSLAAVKLKNGQIHIFFNSVPTNTTDQNQYIFHLYYNGSDWIGPADFNDTFSTSLVQFNAYGHTYIRAVSLNNKIAVSYDQYINYYDGTKWTGEHSITLIDHNYNLFMTYPFFDYGTGSPMAVRMTGYSSLFYVSYFDGIWNEPQSTDDADFILSPLTTSVYNGQLWFSAYQSKNGKIYTLHLDYKDSTDTKYYTAAFSDQEELP
jgi:hypothetical protein